MVKSIRSWLNALMERHLGPDPAGIWVRDIHPPLSMEELKRRIITAIDKHLSQRGFVQIRDEVWTRSRLRDPHDYIYVPIYKKGFPELIGYSFHVGAASPAVDRLRVELLNIPMPPLSPLFAPIIKNFMPQNQSTPDRWNIKATHFSQSMLENSIDALNRFGVSFIEKNILSFSDLPQLISKFGVGNHDNLALVTLINGSSYLEAIDILSNGLKSKLYGETKKEEINKLIDAIEINIKINRLSELVCGIQQTYIGE